MAVVESKLCQNAPTPPIANAQFKALSKKHLGIPIALGLLVLRGGLTYMSREKVVYIGPIYATREKAQRTAAVGCRRRGARWQYSEDSRIEEKRNFNALVTGHALLGKLEIFRKDV
jgi:hypothetical protein